MSMILPTLVHEPMVKPNTHHGVHKAFCSCSIHNDRLAIDLQVNAVFVVEGRTAQLNIHRFLVALRSEEHTSELQSRPHLVCRLLLEKKKKKKKSNEVLIYTDI